MDISRDPCTPVVTKYSHIPTFSHVSLEAPLTNSEALAKRLAVYVSRADPSIVTTALSRYSRAVFLGPS
jgi:hypothetical protein